MDLAVILPLGILLALQGLLSLALLSPRGLSKHAAQLIAQTRKQPAQSVVYTIAAAVFAMTLSSTIQLSANSASAEKTFDDSRCAFWRGARGFRRRRQPPPRTATHTHTHNPHNTTNTIHAPQTPINQTTNNSMLALALGAANLLLLFVNRALGAEQQAADRAKLNLEVLQKQVH